MSAELKPVSIIPPREEIEPNNLPAAGPTSQVPVPASEAAAVLSMIERAARDPAVDVDKLGRLMEMRREALREQAQEEFNTAMAVVQGAMRAVATDANNPQTKSRYASYHALDKAIRPIYSREGLALSFDSEDSPKAEHVRVVCYVTRGKYTRKYQVDMPADGKGAKGGDVMTKTHAAGAAFTYGQRYLLKMIFNIAVGEDDDGNSSGGGEAISQEQVMTLREMLESTGADLTKFLAFFKVEKVSELPAKQFEQAMTMLKQKAKA